MKKVYKAIYRTETIYAEGYIVQYDDNSIEGIFASDYMYIYEYDNNFVCFLKELSYYAENGIPMYDLKFREFYASKQIIRSYETYLFFNNSGGGLSLEINEEIVDLEHAKFVLIDIAKARM